MRAFSAGSSAQIEDFLIARKSFGLTKTKTDNLDCFRIADYAFRQQWEKPVQVSKEQQEARTLSRYIDSLLSQATVVQNKIRLYLVAVFPEIEKIAGKSLFSAGFLNLLKTCPHPQTISRKTIGNQVSGHQGIFHTGVAHGNAVAHGNGRKYQKVRFLSGTRP